MDERLDDLDMGTWDEELVTYQERNNLLIVDGLNLAFRWKLRGKSATPQPSTYAASLVSTINSLAKSYNAREVLFLSDYKGSTYRKGIHPKYKSDRKLKFKDQTLEEKAINEEFFDYYYNVAVPLAEQNFTVVQMEGVEADDLATYFVETFEDGEHFDHLWLISTDGDWDSLLSKTCSRFAYTSRKEFTIDTYYDMKGCDTPEQFTQIKAIMGDMGDSVYGVPGIGLKRAYNLVRQYSDIFGIIDELPIEGKQMFIQELNKSKDLLLLNLQLVDLRSFYQEAIIEANPDYMNKLQDITEELINA